jgi:hypothetical protein
MGRRPSTSAGPLPSVRPSSQPRRRDRRRPPGEGGCRAHKRLLVFESLRHTHPILSDLPGLLSPRLRATMSVEEDGIKPAIKVRRNYSSILVQHIAFFKYERREVIRPFFVASSARARVSAAGPQATTPLAVADQPAGALVGHTTTTIRVAAAFGHGQSIRSHC